MRAVQKVSSHFEYFENRSSGLNVTWQPVRQDLTLHPWTVTLPCWQWDAVAELVYCETVAFSMTEWAEKLHHDSVPAHSSILVQAFVVIVVVKHHITQVCQHPYSPDFAPCDFWLFPKLKSPFQGRRFVNATVIQYTSSVSGVLLLTDWPHGRLTVNGRRVRYPGTGFQVTSRSHDWFMRFSKWLDTFCTAFVCIHKPVLECWYHHCLR
jgi:hypothetical protein